MNYDDYAVQARMIESKIKETAGVEIRWTEELFLDRETNQEWLVFQKVDDTGHEFPRVMHRLGEDGTLQFRSFSR